MSEIYLYRPHKYPWHGTMVRNFFLNRPQPIKYSHFIKGDVKFLLRKFPFSFSGVKSQIREIFEFLLWCIINKQSFFKAKITINTKDRLIIFGHRTIATESNQESDWRIIRSETNYIYKLRCIKIVHLTHFFYGLSQFLENLKHIGADYLIAEGNPSIFNKQLEKELKSYEFHLIPFIPSSRFKSKVPFHKRKHCAVATGTIVPKIKDSNFKYYFGTDCLQRERLELYNFAKENQLERCQLYIENYYDKRLAIQRDYQKQDIVTIYNEYKYYLVTCEVIGFPQIAMYEAAACGCVLISKEEEILSGLGLVPERDYILINSYTDIDNELAMRNDLNDLEMSKRCNKVLFKNSSTILSND